MLGPECAAKRCLLNLPLKQLLYVNTEVKDCACRTLGPNLFCIKGLILVIRLWMNNFINCFVWHVIAYSWLKLNGDLAYRWRSANKWIITHQNCVYMYQCICISVYVSVYMYQWKSEWFNHHETIGCNPPVAGTDTVPATGGLHPMVL